MLSSDSINPCLLPSPTRSVRAWCIPEKCVQAPRSVEPKAWPIRAPISQMPLEALTLCRPYMITRGTADRSSRGCGSFQRPGPQVWGASIEGFDIPQQKITALLTAPHSQDGFSYFNSACVHRSKPSQQEVASTPMREVRLQLEATCCVLRTSAKAKLMRSCWSPCVVHALCMSEKLRDPSTYLTACPECSYPGCRCVAFEAFAPPAQSRSVFGHRLLVSPQAMGGLPPKHAVQTFLGGLDCDFTGCGSGCPPGNSDLRLTS